MERTREWNIGQIVGAAVQYLLAVAIGLYLSAGARSAVVVGFVLLSVGLTACARTSTRRPVAPTLTIDLSSDHPGLPVVLPLAQSGRTTPSVSGVEPAPVRELSLTSQAS